MSETPTQTCARGCPARTASHGVLCDRCFRQLADTMRVLPPLIDSLQESDLVPGSREADESKRTKVTGSPALVRLDVLVALGQGGEAGDGVVPVQATLDRWAGIVARRLGIARPGPGAELQWLTAWLDSITDDRELVPEFWRDMRELQGMLRRITNAPKPIGRCFGHDPERPCGEPLFSPDPTPPATPAARAPQLTVRCPRQSCGRTYRDRDLVLLRIQAERDGVAA